MEKFELTAVAQGSQSIWVAVLVIAIICLTIATVAVSTVIIKMLSVKQAGSARNRTGRTLLVAGI